MTDWNKLLAGMEDAPLNAAEIKEALSMEQVAVHEFGLTFEESPDGRLISKCPFHEDENPSFAIYGEYMHRAGCWSCEFNGDIFDIIQAARDCDFREALKAAKKMIDDQIAVPARRESQTRAVPSAEDLSVAARASYLNALDNSEPIQQFVRRKHLSMSAQWLIENWYIGVASYSGLGAILIPHLGPAKEFTGYKVRSPSTPTIAARGSRLTELYGVWRDKQSTSVILTEGETDAWSASFWFPKADVFGLPTGAQSRIQDHWVERLKYRDVYIIFDGDDAGRNSARKWAKALSSDTHVIRVDLPAGEDICSLGESGVREALVTRQRG